MSRGFRNLGCFLVGVLLVGAPMFAFAAGLIFDNAGNIKGSMVHWSGEGRLRLDAERVVYPLNGGGAAFKATGNIPLSARGASAGSLPIAIIQKVTSNTLAGLLVKSLRGPIPFAISTIPALMELANVDCNADGCWRTDGADGGDIPATGGPGVVTPVRWATSGASICNVNAYTTWQACFAAMPVWGETYLIEFPSGGSYVRINRRSSGVYNTVELYIQCPSGSVQTNNTATGPVCMGSAPYTCPSGQGYTLSGATCTRTPCVAGERREAGVCVPATLTDGDASALIGPELSEIESAEILRQAVDNDWDIPADVPEVEGPSSVQGPSTTKTTHTPTGTTTSTSTPTTTVTYNQNAVTYNTSVVTTTINEAGETTTETEQEPESVTVLNAEFGEIPELYTAKYPDGLVGVWNDKKDEWEATPLASLNNVFSPSIGGGSCPSWSFDANIGPGMMLGTGVISPPCWLWGFLKIVLIITALFISRRIIFGG